MQARWREYLQIAWTTEPVGQHYLRRILTIFKFELNALVAIGFAVPGTLLLAYWEVLPLHGLLWAGGITVLLSGTCIEPQLRVRCCWIRCAKTSSHRRGRWAH